MSDFTIQNIGTTIHGIDNKNGTYTVTTQDSKMGSKPTVETLEAKEIAQKYGKYLNKTPQKDTVEFSNTQSNKLTFDKFMCMVDPFYAQQKIIGDYCKSILPESDPVVKEQVVQALGKLPFANKDYVQNNTNILS